MIAHKLPPPKSFDEAHQAIQRIMKPGGRYIFQHFHDDDCPSIRTHRDIDCSPHCRPDSYLMELEPGETIEHMPDGRQFVAFTGVKVSAT